jgi:protoheme IX farnesyltransferase
MSISDVIQLSKVRLTSSVVFSAIAGYFIAGGSYDSAQLFYLIVGGFLVVASSNGFNQLIEIDLDSKMKRTENRPVTNKANAS